jgi:DNA-binding LacI/PurR family transcriptional regulator
MMAARLGVSHATVSLALHNHPRISPRTRQSVSRLAGELGYRADPHLTTLMHHVRVANRMTARPLIAAFTDFPEGREPHYATAVRCGAERAAAELGYELSVFRVHVRDRRCGSLQRLLLSRGAQGVLVLPMRDDVRLTGFLDWDSFSVVAATDGASVPEFHRVAPDHFGNAQLLCRHLSRRGRRRIGLVTGSHTGPVTTDRFAAGVASLGMVAGRERVSSFVHTGANRPRFRAWFARERPDALIVGNVNHADAIAAELGSRVRSRVEFALSDHDGATPMNGIDQCADAIGRAAVEQLHARIQRTEKGLSKSPTLTLISGRWIERCDFPTASMRSPPEFLAARKR